MNLLTFLKITGLALIVTLGLSAETVRVVFVSGTATIQVPGEAARPVVKGDIVTIGTRIATGATGRVALTPAPGIKSLITPNSSVQLSASAETPAEGSVLHQTTFDLQRGAVVSDLLKPDGVTYDYSIRTPRGTAGARGTTFTVGVNPEGIETVVVLNGTVALNFVGGVQVAITSGQATITQPGGGSQTVRNISELSSADQAIARNWFEISLTAIADAIDSGISVDPKAIANGVEAAESIGIIVSPELKARLETLSQPTTPVTTTRNDVLDPIVETPVIISTDTVK